MLLAASIGHFTFYDLTVTFSFRVWATAAAAHGPRPTAMKSLIIAHLITKVVRLKFVIEVFFFWSYLSSLSLNT